MAELIAKEKNKAYPLHELQPGDRFYFVNDKKKKVYTLADPPFENKKQVRYWIKYANCIDETLYNAGTEQYKADRVVIFLRNKNIPI